jgi:murein DD-endopeptidase MepM/ murein hydrolase activator NlpD
MSAIDDRQKAAQGIESYFMRQMLSELSKTTSASGGFAQGTFQEMFQSAIADAMSSAGGVGIANKLLPPADPAGGPSAAIAPSTVSGLHAYRMHGAHLSMHPIDGRVSSSFGVRHDPIDGELHTHEGVDLAAPAGTQVRAAGGGVVVHAGQDAGYGNFVVIDHGGGLETRYAHLASASVKVGDRVDAGNAIGAVGSTGRSTGPHLHFEVRRSGKSVNPEAEIKLR